MNQQLLASHSLTKRYGRVTVLNQVSLDVQAGEIHALLGANGAGKSTLCRILAGLVQRTAGEVLLWGCPFKPRSKKEAMRSGIQIVQQELNLAANLTVAENLLLTGMPSYYGIIRMRKLFRTAEDLLQRLGIDEIDPAVPLSRLGVGQQQLIEIAAAMHQQCQVLILDEPTASLSARESERLFDWLEQLKQQKVGMIYVTHRLDEVTRLADRFTVLRDGRWIATRPTAGAQPSEMIELMSGPELVVQRHQGNFRSNNECDSEQDLKRKATRTAGQRIDGLNGHDEEPMTNRQQYALKVENLCSGPVRNISFQVACGECLGIAGLVGAGRTELLRAIFGADRAVSGAIYIGQDPTAYRFNHPSQAVSKGIAMLTEDRKESGLLLPMSIAENTSLSSLRKRFSRRGLVRQAAELEESQKMCKFLNTQCVSVNQAVGTLSGGNQQKVAVAKWLVRDCSVFLMDEPTRGIDVAARRRLYGLIHSMAEQGRGLVIVSSEVEELMQICDRIVVLSVGELVAEFTPNRWSHEKIMQACFLNHRQRMEAESVGS